jgi:hypothetical protein
MRSAAAWLMALGSVGAAASCAVEPALSPETSALVGAWEAELPPDIDERLKRLAPSDYAGMRALIDVFGYAYDFRPDGTAERYVAGLGAENVKTFHWRPLRENDEGFEVELVDLDGSVHTTEFERLEDDADVLVETGLGAERRFRRQKPRRRTRAGAREALRRRDHTPMMW